MPIVICGTNNSFTFVQCNIVSPTAVKTFSFFFVCLFRFVVVCLFVYLSFVLFCGCLLVCLFVFFFTATVYSKLCTCEKVYCGVLTCEKYSSDVSSKKRIHN